MPSISTELSSAINERVSSLSLEDKVALLTGRDFWNTVPIDEIGLRNLLLSDGPSGVRGEVWDERSPSLNLPSSSALAAAWSPDLARRYGQALAAEARRKGVDVVLGPTINLHRSPHGGRHFECMSEDPLLTGVLASAYVEAIQAEGVGACPKHYIANDFETDRFTVDVIVDDRTLRELYLMPFEMAVVDSDAWSVMSSYNSINGDTATENDLLQDPLRSEWGFTGVVISDWTAVRSLRSAEKEQDLVMPGPRSPWGDKLVAAVQAGEIEEATVDRKVARLLLMAARVGAIDLGDVFTPSTTGTFSDPVGFSREAAASGMVLVANDGILPLDLGAAPSVAVIGHNSKEARTQGGGSATVLPEVVVSPLDGLRAALGEANVSYSTGAIVQEGIAGLPLGQLTNPATGEPGVHSAFFDADGVELFAEERRSTELVYFGGDAPIRESSSLVYSTNYRALEDETLQLGYAGSRTASLTVDGAVVVDGSSLPEGTNLGASFLSPVSVSAPVVLTAGQEVAIEVTVDLSKSGGPMSNALKFTFGSEPGESDPDALISEAVEAAKASDIAIVVVGTNSDVESEGYDRTSLDLPGQQDALVAAVAAANERTIVIVNSGSPVIMPWRNDVAAVLLSYFPGQSFGLALTDVLFGDVEPGGRLPTTWPALEEDVPVSNVTPDGDGQLVYEEGIHIGYRAWLNAGTAPAYPFGFGLGYTTWSIDSIAGPESLSSGDDFAVEVRVSNTGDRRGRHVVQVYAERPDSSIDRPVRWLVGFADVTLDAGESAAVTVQVRGRGLAHWDGKWSWEPGTFNLLACHDSADSGLDHAVTIG